MEYKLAEIVLGGARNRGNIKPVDSICELNSEDINYSGFVDCYSSVYLHSQEFADYTQAHKGNGNGTGMAGYTGGVKAEFVHWDFDSSSNPEKAYNDAKELMERLVHIYDVEIERIRIYFSGNKGFHVLMISPEFALLQGRKNLPSLIKVFANKCAERLETADTAVYDITRIWRIPNTKHSKTGLYKIPILPSWTFPQVKEKAQQPQKVNFLPIEEFDQNKAIQVEIKSIWSSKKEEKPSSFHFTGGNLIEGISSGFKEGERNNAMFSLGRMLNKKGIDIHMIDAILRMVNEKSGLEEREIQSIIRSVEKHPTDFESREPEETDIVTMQDAYKSWKEKYSATTRIDYGYEKITNSVTIFLLGGEVFYIASRAGCGKTTLSMTIGNNVAKNMAGYTLFFSLEMQQEKIFFRAVNIDLSTQREEGVNSEGVMYHLEEPGNEVKTINNWNKFLIVDKNNLNISQVREYIIKAQAKHKIVMVTIDYFGYLEGKGRSTYEIYSKIAKYLKGMAKELDVRLMVIVQTSREGEDGTKPVKLHYLRDTGAIEESADYVLGMWRSKVDKNRIHAEMLKNRNDELGKRFDFINEGLNFKETSYESDKDDTGATF